MSPRVCSISRFSRFISCGLIMAILIGVLVLAGCQKGESNPNREFENYTDGIFREEVCSNTISLHYTVQNPEEYGIKKEPNTFGDFEVNMGKSMTFLENTKAVLDQVNYEKLNKRNKLTYDILDSYVDTSMKGVAFSLYQEPMSPVSGVQSQLPVLLSEFRLLDEDDVKEYLDVCKTMPEYVDSLLSFERKKAKKGFFMADYELDTVLQQCQAFLDMGEDNYLYQTFEERIKQISDLTEKERDAYIRKHASIMEGKVFPSYRKIIKEMEKLRGSGKNEAGLFYYPNGTAYYDYVIEKQTGSSFNKKQLQHMVAKQMGEDAKAMQEIMRQEQKKEQGELENNAQLQKDHQAALSTESQEVTANLPSAAILSDAQIAEITKQKQPSSANAIAILNTLQNKITNAFPEAPQVTMLVKYVSPAMEDVLSPAFYMIPTIDNVRSNVIYVNRKYMTDSISLFTTLAHEGYPGHLYQTIYFANQNPSPIRSILDFGGYVEGWATYAEMCSYYLSSYDKSQATLLQKNQSLTLGLYAIADLGIHGEGWTYSDTEKFFKMYGIKDTNAMREMFERIVEEPGNYLKYYIGYLEFLELKKEMMARQQDSFTQKEFHEAVLKVGPAPFDVVKNAIRRDP